MYDHVSYMSQKTLLYGQRDTMTQAARLFNRFVRGGVRRSMQAMLKRGNVLLDLNSFKRSQPVRGSHHSGQRIVPIAQIRGTEGRCTDFDAAFHPLSDRSRERWVRIAAAMLDGQSMPPVDLIEMGGVYFVRDGHHRISVAHALGQQAVEATVTTWEVEFNPAS